MCHPGILGSQFSEAVGFVRSQHQPEDDPVPYLQLLLLPALFGNDQDSRVMLGSALNLRQEVRASHFHQ